MNNKKIFIRADANKDIGMGHVMRCLTLAKYLRKRGTDILFLSADTCAAELIEGVGFHFFCLETVYCNMNVAEAVQIKAMMEEQEVFCIIVDSYFVTEEYLGILKSAAKTVCFNSTQKLLTADIIINYNINCEIELYQKMYPDSSVKLLLGSRYVPLREEFYNISYMVRNEVKKVLLMTGGSDPNNFMGGFLKKARAAQTYTGIEFTCVCGNYNMHYSKLLHYESEMKNVKIIKGAEKISQLMQESDIVFSAGGTTMYELCAVGVPTILFSFADNQVSESSYMERQGIMAYAGDYAAKGFWERIFEKFDKLVKDGKMRQEMSKKMKNSVDGRGAGRISDMILDDDKQNFENTKEFWEHEIVRARMLYPDEFVIRFAKKNFEPGPDVKILDFGCGAGRNALALAQEGYSVTAMDYNDGGLELLRQRAQAMGVRGITCIRNTGLEVPLNEEIDAIVADGSLFYYDRSDTVKLLKNLKQCLREGGLFWADWRNKEDSMYGKGEKIEEGLFKLGADSGRGGCNYFFADREELEGIYGEAGLEIISFDTYYYTKENGSTQCSWYHIVAK